MAMNPQVISNLCPRRCGRMHRKVRCIGVGSEGALVPVLRHSVRQLRGCVNAWQRWSLHGQSAGRRQGPGDPGQHTAPAESLHRVAAGLEPEPLPQVRVFTEPDEGIRQCGRLPGGTRIPLRPSWTMDGIWPTALAITGSAAAMYSKTFSGEK